MSRYFPTPDEFGRHTIFGTISIATYAGERLQFSIADLPANSVVGEHAHPNEQMGLVVSGRVRFSIGDEEKTLGPGDIFCVPGGVVHKVVTLEEPARVLDVFYPIRDEYR
jgi:quercetin dioxygenase-like cupin family protein